MSDFKTPDIKNKRVGSAMVLGAGPTGLATAWRLAMHGWKVTIIEKEDELGGFSRTQLLNGYSVDFGPHKLYPQNKSTADFIKYFVGNDLLIIPKKSTIYLRNNFIAFPFGLGDLIKGLGLTAGVMSGVGLLWGKFISFFKKNIKTYSDFVVSVYGTYAHKLVFEQLAKKLWGDPDKLDVQLAKTRVVVPSLLELVVGILFGTSNKPKLNADEYWYPRGGIKILWNNIAKEIEKNNGRIIRSAKITKLSKDKNGLFVAQYSKNSKNEQAQADVVVSTMPASILLDVLEPRPSQEIIIAASKLRLVPLLMLYVVVDSPRLLDVNWVFFPELKYVFSRVSEQKSFSEEMIPAGRTVLMVEIPLARPELKSLKKEQLIDQAVKQLRETGILKNEHKIIETFTAYNELTYPVYDLDYKENLGKVLDYSDKITDFYLNGRSGLFCYNNMDHGIEMGMKLADHIAGHGDIDAWRNIRETFYQYKIID